MTRSGDHGREMSLTWLLDDETSEAIPDVIAEPAREYADRGEPCLRICSIKVAHRDSRIDGRSHGAVGLFGQVLAQNL